MRILLNTVSTKKQSGGAYQIAYNFLMKTIEHQEVEWIYVVSKDLDKIMPELLKAKENYYVFPNLGVYNSFEEIDFDSLPDQFVLKTTHDSGTMVIVKNKAIFDKEAANKKLTKALSRNYYWEGRELPYKNVKPRIVAEPYMTDGTGD